MKLTQEKMANNLDISTSSYNQYEKGKRNVPDEVAKQIAIILNMNVLEIFTPKKYSVIK